MINIQKKMNINNLNSLNESFVRKFIELEKNYLILKSQLEGKIQNDQNYKTELCKKFMSTGFCPYGNKCRFAHGKNELITKIQGANYKTDKCKSFYEKGYCPYGSRCKFQHDERKFNNINFSYFYLRMFLLKYFGFFKHYNNYNSKKGYIFNKRLPVFVSMTSSYKENVNKNDK